MAENTAYLACAVHVPLLTMQEREINHALWDAYDARVEEFRAFDPELVIVFGGDHYDNVFLNLAPQFMVGHRATAVDDVGGRPGPLDVPMDVSRACAEYLVEEGFDVATSYDMGIDHGFSNMLGLFLGKLDSRPVLPIYVNALTEPRPTLRRCRQIGEAVGNFARGLDKRVAFLGSGGLSHHTEKYFPQFTTAPDDTLRDYIVSGGTKGSITRNSFMQKIKDDMDVLSAELVSGARKVPWINPDWDRNFLETFTAGDLTKFDSWTDGDIIDNGGSGASEIRQWVAAASAAQAAGAGNIVVDYYSSETPLAVGVGVVHSRLSVGAQGSGKEPLAMAFHNTDPRAGLPGARPVGNGDVPPATFVAFTPAIPHEQFGDGSRSWLVRSQNLVLEYCVLEPGDSIVEPGELHESVVLAPTERVGVDIAFDDDVIDLDDRGLVAMPPGSYSVTARERSEIVRLRTTANDALVGSAVNFADYAVARAAVAPLVLWPEPHGAQRPRKYLLKDAPESSGRFGNIFRTRAFMVNFLNVDPAPRDPDRLSPHVHDDFEQISLVVEGTYVHHVRTPWTPQSSRWLPDVHQEIGAPSVAIIPPGAIHTSQSVGPGKNALIDIFSPPREDFSAKDGWVLNAVDYPRRPTETV